MESTEPASPSEDALEGEEESPEAQLGGLRIEGSPAAQATNDALLALGRAARSFTFYGRDHVAIRQFLEKFKEDTDAALSRFGPMELSLRPFEILRDGEVVYVEPDRERSLAYRLFRDGVRTVRLRPDVSWDERLRLLEILSICFTGVRQQEDDTVTLLRKAGFAGIDVMAVEGVVPDDEADARGEGGEGAGAGAVPPRGPGLGAGEGGGVPGEILGGKGQTVLPPRDWDCPWDVPEAPGALAYVPVDPAHVAALSDEESDARLPANVVWLVAGLLHAVDDVTDPTTLVDIEPFLEEAGDYLLGEGAMAELVSFLTMLEPRGEDARKHLARLTEPASMVKMARALEDRVQATPDELLILLDRTANDPLEAVLGVLAEDNVPERRQLMHRALTVFGPRAPDAAIDSLKKIDDDALAVALLDALFEGHPETGTRAAAEVCTQKREGLLLEALDVLRRSPHTGAIGRALTQLLDAPFEAVRTGSMEELARRREGRAFDALLERAERRAGRDLGKEEALAVGRALIALDAKRAFEQFQAWTKTKGRLLRKIPKTAGQKAKKWIVVGGVGLLPGADATSFLEGMIGDADDRELSGYLKHLVHKRQREGA